MVGGVSGAFLTGDIFNLYVWFEVLLISSFGLLISRLEREQLDGATKYAILNLIGTTLFLIAVGIPLCRVRHAHMADIAARAPALGNAAPMMTLSLLFIRRLPDEGLPPSPSILAAGLLSHARASSWPGCLPGC